MSCYSMLLPHRQQIKVLAKKLLEIVSEDFDDELKTRLKLFLQILIKIDLNEVDQVQLLEIDVVTIRPKNGLKLLL